jgi:hypothetical protein
MTLASVLTAAEDEVIRHRYFYGARVERYKTGVFDGEWRVYDVNSMYPYVMSAYYHPVGHVTNVGREITPNTYFLTVSGRNRTAFPTRTKTGVAFDLPEGVFTVSIHEYNAAVELGLFDLDDIIETIDFESSRCFCDYIAHYYAARKLAKDSGDRIHDIFYKYLLNNSYGKFAVNPENFQEYRLTDDQTDLRWYGYSLAEVIPQWSLILWSKESDERKYVNIATGASITGAARSVLLRGLYHADSPVYCDTDSIICKGLGSDSQIDNSQLGAWKLEKTGDSLAIAGRKMYALFSGGQPVKWASKGVRITPDAIRRAALGETITYTRDSPTFKLNGDVQFLTRNVRSI